jgi:hexokinase
MTLPDLCSTFEPAFFLKDQKLKDIVEQFKKEMKEGLEDYGKDMAPKSMQARRGANG